MPSPALGEARSKGDGITYYYTTNSIDFSNCKQKKTFKKGNRLHTLKSEPPFFMSVSPESKHS
uniref:SFRICE_037879 n=1 Tax=Spodoptera frugiperda TaxID=7108 RepID=A0A2H1WJG5_SPOFR